jgi:hypothetical protein
MILDKKRKSIAIMSLMGNTVSIVVADDKMKGE